MTTQHALCLPALLIGAAVGLATPSVVAQEPASRSRVEQEQPSVDGDSSVVLEAEAETVRLGARTTRSTRREYGTDAEGRSTLLATVEEDRVERPAGGGTSVRRHTQPDVNGQPRVTRRETDETVARGDGLFSTTIEVSVPGADDGRFVPTERVEVTERRDGARVLESERTTYTSLTNRGAWDASEQRLVRHAYEGGEVRTTEYVYRPGGSGEMALSDQIVRREWTRDRGEVRSREEIFATDIPGQERSSEPRLFQQVETVRTIQPDGSTRSTREVTEQRNSRAVVVERVIERARSDGRGGTVIERETQRRDVNGQLRTVAVSRARGDAPQ